MTLSTYSYAVTECVEVDSSQRSYQPNKYVSTRSQAKPKPYLIIAGIGILLMISLVIVYIHQIWLTSIRFLKH